MILPIAIGALLASAPHTAAVRVRFVATGAELLWPGQPARSFVRQ
jgi:hypothetical protein